jgi:hypothetical protein
LYPPDDGHDHEASQERASAPGAQQRAGHPGVRAKLDIRHDRQRHENEREKDPIADGGENKARQDRIAQRIPDSGQYPTAACRGGEVHFTFRETAEHGRREYERAGVDPQHVQGAGDGDQQAGQGGSRELSPPGRRLDQAVAGGDSDLVVSEH